MKKTELFITAIDIIKTHHSLTEETVQPLCIGNMEYSSADAWLSLDPIAYRESLFGFADMVLTEDQRYSDLKTEQRRTIEHALSDYGSTADGIRFALLY
jgi:hypothetical protein